MAWSLIISETADKQLAKLDKSIEKRVRAYLDEACNLADPADRGVLCILARHHRAKQTDSSASANNGHWPTIQP
jgi:mRNA-degrading endonuclease RelE of RelBE toxin-antitoxin system